jgi:hypothetical protein
MNIEEIKKLENKTFLSEFKGIVVVQHPPEEQNSGDKRYGHHRQKIEIADDSGDRISVIITQKEMHILDNIEGSEIIFTRASPASKDIRLDKWEWEGNDSFAIKLYRNAKMKVTKATQQEATPSVTLVGVTEFEKSLALNAYGYSLCLDTASEVVSGRKHLKDDGESIRAIATNLWMGCKNKIHTLVPEKPVAEPKPEPKPSNSKSSDKELISKLISGITHKALSPKSWDAPSKLPSALLKSRDEVIQRAEFTGKQMVGMFYPLFRDKMTSVSLGPADKRKETSETNIGEKVMLTKILKLWEELEIPKVIEGPIDTVEALIKHTEKVIPDALDSKKIK